MIIEHDYTFIFLSSKGEDKDNERNSSEEKKI